MSGLTNRSSQRRWALSGPNAAPNKEKIEKMLREYLGDDATSMSFDQVLLAAQRRSRGWLMRFIDFVRGTKNAKQMKPFVRLVAIALLVLIGCGVACMGFLYTRLLLVGLPERVIVIPADYEGVIYLVEDRIRGQVIPVDGLWRQTATIRVPKNGILIVRDKTPMHWITKEKVMLTDGTIIDGTGMWSQRPSRFRHLGESYRGGLPKGHPLEPFRNPDGSIEYSAMEVSKTPQFNY